MAFWNGITIGIYSRRMPDAEMLCAIADYFHVSVDFLLRHEGEPNCTSYNQKGCTEQ